MHKNTLLFTSVLAVAAALLVGFRVGRRFQQPPSSPSPTPAPSPTAKASMLETFTSQACGITFQYPNSLNKLDGASGSAILTDPANEKNSIVVTCQADIPRPPLPADKIETVAIASATGAASVSARLYHDASAKDGTLVDALIFLHPTRGVDVFIAGFGEVFQGILATLRLLN